MCAEQYGTLCSTALEQGASSEEAASAPRLRHRALSGMQTPHPPSAIPLKWKADTQSVWFIPKPIGREHGIWTHMKAGPESDQMKQIVHVAWVVANHIERKTINGDVDISVGFAPRKCTHNCTMGRGGGGGGEQNPPCIGWRPYVGGAPSPIRPEA